MTRYVLIDKHSGYVWGEAEADDPVDACRRLDAEIAGNGYVDEHEYCLGNAEQQRDASQGYFVYVAPDDWPEVTDGRSQTEIERVMALPEVAYVSVRRRAPDYPVLET